MKIKSIVVGPIEANCYILYNEVTKEAVIIDAGDEPSKILDFINKNSLKVLYIISTHGHFDHVKGVPELRRVTGVPFLIHKKDAILLSREAGPILGAMGIEHVETSANRLLGDGEIIKFADSQLKVIHTPGHSQGGICLYSEKEKALFSGDTLFAGDVGRTDFPYCSFEELKRSIKSRLFTLPDDTKVYPGHGDPTTIKESKDNQYLKNILK